MCLELVFIIKIDKGFSNILIENLHRNFPFSYTNLSYLILFKDFIHVDILPSVWLFTMCVLDAHEAQKRVLDPLALELHAAVASGCWESNLSSPGEQPVLLTLEPSLSPNFSYFIPSVGIFWDYNIIILFLLFFPSKFSHSFTFMTSFVINYCYRHINNIHILKYILIGD